jgi:hypothetical protein
MNLKREVNAILTIAFRDFSKLIRDRFRLLSSLIFPLIFIGVLGKISFTLLQKIQRKFFFCFFTLA